MVKKVNKFLILLTKILVVATVSVLLSCSSDSGQQDEENVIPDKDTVVTPDESQDDLTDSHSSDDAAPSEEEPDEELDEEQEEKPDEPEEESCSDAINSVVIGTYNTHLFFDKVCDSDSCSSSDFESVPSNSEYNAKVRDLAESVKEIGADIILLQEVEKESCLKDLFEKSGSYDEFFLGEKGYSASVDTGVMTKGKITYKHLHPEQIECPDCEGGKTTFTRAFLETHIEFGCRKIIVFSAHFRSKNDDDPSRRLAEAAAAAKILKKRAEEYPDALIVMGGDLNDEPGSDTLGYFENDSAFLRVANELSTKNQATYYYRGDAIALDHIFWVKTDGGTYKKGSAEVVKDAPSYYSLGSSDHAALKATFEF